MEEYVKQIMGDRPIVRSVVPTIREMAEKNAQKKKEEFLALAEEDQHTMIGEEMPLSEMINTVRDSIRKCYPKASMMVVGLNMNEKAEGVYDWWGEEEMTHMAMVQAMHRSRKALQWFNQVLRMFVVDSTSEEAEMCITAMQDIIIDLRKMNDPEEQLKLKRSEVNRLKKEKREDLVKVKLREIEELEERIRKAEHMKKVRQANIVKAREARALLKKKREQLEKERNRQQPNFAKQAKQRMRKMAERKAEKRKKSASGSGDDTVRSCSMFQNAG